MVVTTLLFTLVKTAKLCIKWMHLLLYTFYLFIKKLKLLRLLESRKHVYTKKQVNFKNIANRTEKGNFLKHH